MVACRNSKKQDIPSREKCFKTKKSFLEEFAGNPGRERGPAITSKNLNDRSAPLRSISIPPQELAIFPALRRWPFRNARDSVIIVRLETEPLLMRIVTSLASGQLRRKPLILFGSLVVGGFAAYQCAQYVLTGDFIGLTFAGMALVMGTVVVGILNN